jgi:hypothetical protein
MMDFDQKYIQDAVIVKEYCRKTGVLEVCAFTDEIIFAGDDSRDKSAELTICVRAIKQIIKNHLQRMDHWLKDKATYRFSIFNSDDGRYQSKDGSIPVAVCLQSLSVGTEQVHWFKLRVVGDFGVEPHFFDLLSEFSGGSVNSNSNGAVEQKPISCIGTSSMRSDNMTGCRARDLLTIVAGALHELRGSEPPLIEPETVINYLELPKISLLVANPALSNSAETEIKSFMSTVVGYDESLACHEQCVEFNNQVENIKSYALEYLQAREKPRRLIKPR